LLSIVSSERKHTFVEEISIMHGNKTFKVNQTDYSLDLSWDFEDLKLYDHQSNPILATIFTMIAGVTLVLGAIVHRAIFKLLKRIPQRPINAIIYPNLVCITLKNIPCNN
jgi:hypothetical protein